MAIDIIGISLLLIFFIYGYRRGMIMAVFSLLASIAGIICALKLSHSLASYLDEKGIISSPWGQIISYIILFLLVAAIVRLIGKALQSTFEAIMLGFFNRLAGGFLYALLGALIWSTLLWLGSKSHIISSKEISESKTYSFFSGIAPWLVGQLGRFVPFAKDIFAQLSQYFDKTTLK